MKRPHPFVIRRNPSLMPYPCCSFLKKVVWRKALDADMNEAGIIDPPKIVRGALQNAVSVASLLITTEAVVAEKPKKEASGLFRFDLHGGFKEI